MLSYNIDNKGLDSLFSDNIRLIRDISLDSLMYEAEKIKQMSKDIYVYKNELKSMANEYGFYFAISNKKYMASDWAVNYICSSYGIPKRYISNAIHMAREKKYRPLIALVNDTFNTFLNSPDYYGDDVVNKRVGLRRSKYLVRILGDNYIRAIRSENFRVRDNFPLLLDIKDTINAYYNITEGIINKDVLVLRMYLKEVFKYGKKDIKVGVQIKNSETGFYALQVQILISIDNIEFTSEKILEMRHNAKAVTSVDVNGYLKDIAIRYKNNVVKYVKNIIRDNSVNEEYYTKVVPELKNLLNKDDYIYLLKISKKRKRINIAKEILMLVKEYDFIRKEKIENLIVNRILELKVNI